MSEQIFDKITTYFKNRHFDRIPTDSDAVMMFGTYEANHLYLINIIQLVDGYTLDFDRYLEYKQLTMEQFSGNSADKIILLNITITDEVAQIQEVFNYTPDLTESFIDVNWLIDKEEETLVIPKKQLKNVIGIEKDLRRMLKKEETVYYNLPENQGPPLAVYGLIAMNVLVWLYMSYVGSSTDISTLVSTGAIKYDLIFEEHEYYRLLNGMFIHIGMAHLFHNMFSLYIFGARLERFLHPVQFLMIYLLSGLAGSIFSLGAAGLSGYYPVSAGASGAVYGLMGSLLFITMKRRRHIEGMSTYVLWLFFVLGIVYSLMTPGIDILAHIGGFVAGILLTMVLLFGKRKIDGSGSAQ